VLSAIRGLIFAKPRRSFFQIVQRFCVGLLSDERRFVITPKRIVILLCILGFRHSLAIRNSSFGLNSSFRRSLGRARRYPLKII
jgi:hypothetical protein